MKWTQRIILVTLLIAGPSWMNAQVKRDAAFKEKYTLKEVVVLSRHNIRSPLSGKGSLLEKVTPHTWHEWSSGTSELTLKGGLLETTMGQFFRKWLVYEGLFPENHQPSADEVHIYANSMQRTLATARYFSSGFMPVANLTIHHRFAPSKMDPIFAPQLTKVSDAFVAEATRQIDALCGKGGVEGLSRRLEPNYQLLSQVLDMKESQAYGSGTVKGFTDHSHQLAFVKGKEPAIKGNLKLATSIADALVLQYYEEPDSLKASFGHPLTTAEWESLSIIKDTFVDVLFTAPVVAYNVAHPLLVYLYDELKASPRKFTFLCGHDSNIASVNAALEVEPYELPESIEKKTPIGCKLVFEKWVDKEGKPFISLQLVYQSARQLRNLQLLDEKVTPQIQPLRVKGLRTNADGLYSFEEIGSRFEKAITAYDKLP